ncbi:YciI family protein [Streptosporangium sp. NPDC001559]|uniref:YciI family protein n=1 Tax=Streptosporangium sp. NPDC001559 TaxID=3366187 RepID=UPI0036EDEC99
MLMIYNNPETWEVLSNVEQDGLMDEARKLAAELTASGEWVGGDALADRSRGRTVRVRDGDPMITDGPFIEAKEHLAGYCVIDCATEERALEIAARWPDARICAVEIRPIEPPE